MTLDFFFYREDGGSKLLAMIVIIRIYDSFSRYLDKVFIMQGLYWDWGVWKIWTRGRTFATPFCNSGLECFERTRQRNHAECGSPRSGCFEERGALAVQCNEDGTLYFTFIFQGDWYSYWYSSIAYIFFPTLLLSFVSLLQKALYIHKRQL